MPRGNPKNLVKNTDLTPEELSRRNSKAGKASVKARREKKRMSQIYADFLEKEHEVVMKDGTKRKLSGTALLNSVMSKVMSRGDGSSVRLMKEIREGTEGSKVNVDIEPLMIKVTFGNRD